MAGTDAVVAVSWRLREMLAIVHRAGRLTDGRFDAAVVDALEALGEHGASLEADGRPGPMEPATGVPREGLDRASRVVAPASPVDSGGIGKGLALRWAARRAIALLPAGAGLLLDAGGDIVAAGVAPPEGWLVGIEDPAADDDAEPLAVVPLEGGNAIATSSVRVRAWTSPSGEAVHHLVDPRTGRPARTGLIAVTVAGADPAWAEVWTKALFLAGREAIGPEARRRGLAAWWVSADGTLGMTPAARERSMWVAEARVG